MDRRPAAPGRDRTLPPTHLHGDPVHLRRRRHTALALTGRGKKNWKSADLILAALYRFLAWESPQGNDCFLLANDEGQAGDDVKLLKKVIAVTPCFDLMAQGKRGEDPRMFFSWYSSEFCTDPNYADADPEGRANP
jgi:hypothetical protein